jgi:hypothetical protein
MKQRKIASDAQIAADRVHEAFADLRFLKAPQKLAEKFELIGYVGSAQRWLVIAIKFVPAARAKTGVDEWWISTAYPIGEERLRRLQSSGKLASIAPTG